jgi:hypothetical protein
MQTIAFLMLLMTILIPVAKRTPSGGWRQGFFILIVSLIQVCIVVFYLFTMEVPSGI